MYKELLKQNLPNLLKDCNGDAYSIWQKIKESRIKKNNINLLKPISKSNLYLILNELTKEDYLCVHFNRDLHPKRFPIKVYFINESYIKK